MVRFSPGHSSVKVPTFIHSDNIIECAEAFQVTLHIPDKYSLQGITESSCYIAEKMWLTNDIMLSHTYVTNSKFVGYTIGIDNQLPINHDIFLY